MISRLWLWLHSSDPRTWIGHGLQGFFWGVFADIWPFSFWLAAIFLLVMFGVREGEGIVRAIAAKDRTKLVDGVLDLVSPFIGLTIFILISS